MQTDNPITFEQAKDEIQALSGHIKSRLSQTKTQRDIEYLTALLDEFTQAALNRMLKLYLQGQQEDKPKSSAEHIDDMIRRLCQRFAVQ